MTVECQVLTLRTLTKLFIKQRELNGQATHLYSAVSCRPAFDSAVTDTLAFICSQN